MFLTHEGLTTPTSLSLRLSRPPRKGEEISISEFVNLHTCERSDSIQKPRMKGLRHQRCANDRKLVPRLLRSARTDETDVLQKSNLVERCLPPARHGGCRHRHRLHAPRHDPAQAKMPGEVPAHKS